MAFPTVVGVTHTHVTANATSIACTVPDGSNVLGRLLMICVSLDGAVAPTSWPSPAWDGVSSGGADGGSASYTEIRHRVIDGSEGFTGTGDTVTVNGPSEEWASTAYLIQGHAHSTSVSEKTAVTGASGNVNPASETASWGAEDNLWIVFATLDASVTVTGFPAGFTDNQHGDNTVGTGGVTHASASQNLNTATVDPGTFTNGSESWRAITFVVRPGTEGIPSGLVQKRFEPVPSIAVDHASRW